MSFEKPCMRRFVPCDSSQPPRPELWDGETIDYELNDVELSFSSTKPPIGSGQLFITSKRVVWLGIEDAAFDFDVPYIALHAISRDLESYPKPCIYCQLDCDNSECGDGDESNDEEEEPLDELFLAPASDAVLTEMFNALSAAALNNPDPPEDGDEEGDDELIYNISEVELGAQQARTLNHLESVFNLPPELDGGDEEEEEEEDEGDFDEGTGDAQDESSEK